MLKGLTTVVWVQEAGMCTRSAVTSFFDSLRSIRPGVALVVVPASDIDSAADTSQIKLLTPLDSGKLVILKTSGARKARAGKRSELAQWLTTASQNSHFDLDVSTAGNIYVINSLGEVTAALQKPVSFSTVTEVLKNN